MLPDLSKLGVHDADETGVKPTPKGAPGPAGRAFFKLIEKNGKRLPMGPAELPMMDMPTPAVDPLRNAWLRIADPNDQSKITSLFTNVNPETLTLTKDTMEWNEEYNRLSIVGAFDIVYKPDHPLLQRYKAKRTAMSSAPRACLTWATREECVRTDAVLSDLHAKKNVNELGTLNDKVNEKYLLHGTTVDGIKGIVYKGFDMGIVAAAAFGKAIYHAEDPEKANQYVTSDGWKEFNEELQISSRDLDNTYYIIVSRVLLGCANHIFVNQMNKREQIKDPLSNSVYTDFLNSRMAGDYDSVIKEHGMTVRGTYLSGDKFREFLVVDAAQALPVMVIAYTRKYDDLTNFAYDPGRFQCDNISPLVTLLLMGTDAEKESAARLLALMSNANYFYQSTSRYDTNERIMQANAITPLVMLLNTGSYSAKRWSSIALGSLVYWAISRESANLDLDQSGKAEDAKAGIRMDVRKQLLRANVIAPLLTFFYEALEATEDEETRSDVEPPLFESANPKFRGSDALRFDGREAAVNLIHFLILNASGRDEDVCRTIIEQGAAVMLVRALRNADRTTNAVIQALHALSIFPKGAEDIYEKGGIPHLLALVRPGAMLFNRWATEFVSSKALVALVNIVDALSETPHRQSALQQIADTDLVGEDGIHLLTRRVYQNINDVWGSQNAARLLDAISRLSPEYESRVTYQLRALAPRAPHLTVFSHNINWQNNKLNTLATQLSNNVHEYHVVCLQECTDTFLTLLKEGTLPTSHALLHAKTCAGERWAVLAYSLQRFELVGDPWFGCFELKSKKMDENRPVVSAVLRDRKVGRLMIVGSLHAPHGSDSDNYRLSTNLARFIREALRKAGDVPWSDVKHVLFAGDYNRKDWQRGEPWEVEETMDGVPVGGRVLVRLHSAQNGLNGIIPTQGIQKPIPIDNVLYGSRVANGDEHTLELARFMKIGKIGSDHEAIAATFSV